MKPFYTETTQAVLGAMDSARDGLTTQEAQSRLAWYGPNRLKQEKKPTLLRRFLEQLKDPMLLILMGAAGVSAGVNLYAGESPAEAAIILAVVALNAVLGVLQQRKAESALEALQTMTAAQCKALRDGVPRVIPAGELVPGDVILLEAGDAVPADGRILEAARLRIEESALTGESVPVSKETRPFPPSAEEIPLGDRKNMCYMGSMVVYGRGCAVVTATGMDTEMGKIAGALASEKEEPTPLQRRLGRLGTTLTRLVLVICALMFGFRLALERAVTPGAVLSTFMAAVSLAVAAIPEGLATVVTVVLSIGVTNMTRRRAVIRRLTAVETLGCTQVICSDKTGTLTRNQMTVVEHWGDLRPLAAAMALCSDARPVAENQVAGEPTEAALVQFALDQGLAKDVLEQAEPRVDEIPFDAARKMMSTLHTVDGGFVQYTKGAPDEVLTRCTAFWDGTAAQPMTPEKMAEISEANRAMAGRALRVLAAAMRKWDAAPAEDTGEFWERELCFLGLAGMIDPVRPEVKEAMSRCREAGICPVMITGDHGDTAAAIARELGMIQDASQAVTGAALSALSDEEIRRYRVFARVQPEHKVRIVNAWKQVGAVTAMTGDGVNDAPAVKAADIGVGMGISGTDVTKSAADMVLSDDNFATIVSAVEEGRRIYDNIRKAIAFLLASNMAEVLGVVVSTLLGFTLLGPAHLLFINLITDCFPALALGMERAEPDVMRRPPRDPREGFFAGGLGFDVAYQGVLVTVITLISWVIGCCMEAGRFVLPQGVSSHGMTMAFLTMSMCEIFHAFNMRAQRKSVFTLKNHNPALWAAMAGSLGLTTLVLEVPVLARAFGFTPISFSEYGIALGLAVLVIPAVEAVKAVQRRWGK